MKRRICRKRTGAKYLDKEMIKLKMKLVEECEQVMPILSDAAFLDVFDPSIQLQSEIPTPEDALISKDILTALSDEAKSLAEVILTCPEEFFLQSGRISNRGLYKLCKEKLGWGKPRTEAIRFELGLYLQHACM